MIEPAIDPAASRPPAPIATPRRWPPAATIAWIALLALAAIDFALAARWLARGPFTDLPIFLRTARRFADGGALYESARDASTYAPSAAVFKYPPLYALLLRPFLGLSIGAACRLLFALHVALYLGAVGGWLRIVGAARRGAPFAATAAGIVAALTFGPAFETLRGVQLELPILALMALAAVAWRARRDAWLGALLAVAAALKVYPLFLLLPLLATRRFRALAAFALASALLAGLCIALFGAAECRTWLVDVLPAMLRELPSDAHENLALARPAMALGLDPALAKRLTQLVALPIVLASCWLAARATRRGGEAETLVLPLFAAVMLVAMPNAWMNYQILLLPALLGLLAAAARRTAARGAAAAAIVAWLLCAFTCDHPLFAEGTRIPAPFVLRVVDLRWIATVAIVVATAATMQKLTREPSAAAGMPARPA